MTKQPMNTICLGYDRDAEEAARFDARPLPDSAVGAVHLAPGDLMKMTRVDIASIETVRRG
jgi:predicted 3-demethylubiquinone-9 3-methyltransferase (glyoxalase superfamily)